MFPGSDRAFGLGIVCRRTSPQPSYGADRDFNECLSPLSRLPIDCLRRFFLFFFLFSFPRVCLRDHVLFFLVDAPVFFRRTSLRERAIYVFPSMPLFFLLCVSTKPDLFIFFFIDWPPPANRSWSYRWVLPVLHFFGILSWQEYSDQEVERALFFQFYDPARGARPGFFRPLSERPLRVTRDDHRMVTGFFFSQGHVRAFSYHLLCRRAKWLRKSPVPTSEESSILQSQLQAPTVRLLL